MRLAIGILATVLILAIPLAIHQCNRPDPWTRDTQFFAKGEEAYFAGEYETAIDLFLQGMESAPRDPRPYYRLVDAHHWMGDPAGAEEILRALLESEEHRACARYGLGCLALKRQDHEAALAEAERAIELDRHFGYAHLLLGSVHNQSGRPDDALRAWRRAREIFQARGEGLDESWARNRIGLIHRQSGRLREARGEFEKALELQREAGDAGAQIIVLGNLGLTQADMGELGQALASFDAALALSRETGDRYSECWNRTNLAFLQILAGQYHAAIASSDSAVALARRTGSVLDEISGLQNRAIAYNDLGDPIRSLEDSELALRLAEGVADPRHRAGVLQVRAESYLFLHRLDRARETFSLCDSLHRETGVVAGSGTARIGLCEVAVEKGDTTAAVALAERTMNSFHDQGYAEGEEFLAILLSDLTLARGDAVEARALADRAIELSRRDGRRGRQSLGRIRRARALHALGEGETALRDARVARELAVAIRNPRLAWLSGMTIGDIVRDTDPEEALQFFHLSMDELEGIQQGLRLEEYRAGHLERRLDLYWKTADLLVSLDRVGEALCVCERSRGRALSDFLSTAPQALRPDVPSDLARESEAAESRLRTHRATLSSIASLTDTDAGRVARLEREIARIRAERDQLRSRILLLDPRFGAVFPETGLPEIEEIQRGLAPDELLLEYFCCSRGTLCFLVTAENVKALHLHAGAGELGDWITALRRPLLSPRSLSTLSFDDDAARRLRECLIDPLLPHLSGVSRVTIVPDGPLNLLPFEILPSPTRDAHFFGGQYTLGYLPSAGFPILAARRSARTATADSLGSMLAMGDPAPEEGNGTLAASGREIRAIRRFFPGADIRQGRDATEQAFIELAPGYRRLHLAAHADADAQSPLYSSIRLARDRTGNEDGLLHAHEVLQLRLNCDLVVLSACETGLGRNYSGEGLLGMTRAFFYAGASQALVSLWRVDDTATAWLMEVFYEGLSQGLEVGEALRRAKLALRERSIALPGGGRLSCDHPYFWGGFILTGADQSRSYR